MPQAQVFGGHGSGEDDVEFGGGQAHLHASVDEAATSLTKLTACSVPTLNSSSFPLSKRAGSNLCVVASRESRLNTALPAW